MKKKFIFDTAFNMISSAVPILLLQLIILPFLAKDVGQDKYGLIISIVSISLLTSQPLGNVLNNIRLLKDSDYKKLKISGDFLRILWIMILFNILSVSLLVFLSTKNYGIISFILVIAISTLSLLKEYGIVDFRIKLNFINILISNLLLSLGYLIGYFIFKITSIWEIVYLLGLILSLIFIYYKGNIYKETFKKTDKYPETFKDTILLFISVFLKSSIKQLDKFLLLILLGASSVSIYYTATFPGKFMSLLVTPISGVMLSYLSKMKMFKNKHFISLLITLVLLSSVGYTLILIIGPFILNYLYPDWASESNKLLYLTGLIAIFTTISSFIHPIILRFKELKWQFLINSILFITTISLSVLFSLYWEIEGYVLGITIAGFINIIVMLVVYILVPQKKDSI